MEKAQTPRKASSFTGRDDDEKKKKSNAVSNELEAVSRKSESDAVDSNSDIGQTGEIDEQRGGGNVEEPCSAKIDFSLLQSSEEIDLFIDSLSDANQYKEITPEAPESVELYVKFLESLVEKYERGESSTKFGQVAEEDLAFLESLSRISRLAKALNDSSSGSTPTSSSSSSLNRTGSVLHRAMSVLEEEFRSLLEDSRTSSSSSNLDHKSMKKKQSSFRSDNHDADRSVLSEPETPHEGGGGGGGGGGDEQFPTYSPESVSNMNRIATAMISSGYETECCQVYSIVRRCAFKEALKKLGFETISIDDVQRMQWETLEGVIATWISVVKQCSNLFFPGERKFCIAVFSDHPEISRSLFGDLTRSVVLQLLNFAEAVAMTKRAAEKLFKFLDMHEALRDLIPAIDGVSSEDSSHELKTETSAAASRLGEAAVSIFCELENSIKSDNGRQPVPSGAVHPLTRYTMNYLKYACDEYRDTLEQVFQQHRKIERPDEPIESESEKTTIDNQHNHNQTIFKHSPFGKQLMAVMDLLDLNLDSKSKLYRDPSLRYIFLMNNGRYILQKIKACTEIHAMVGDTWRRKRSSDLRQYHKNYQRETWGRLLGCLGHEGLLVNGKVHKPALKERFKSFNAMFDEIHRVQSTWVVSDVQLQSELRVSISSVVIPAYRSFLGRFSQHMEGGKQSEKYIKYQPEDIETLVDDLFEGNPTSMARRRT